MFVAAAGQAGSGLNPAYYSLGGAATGERAARSVTYDAQTRTAYVSFGNLSADDYTLTADAALTSRNGQRLGGHYSTGFSACADIRLLVVESGGASSRERGCEDGWISVVAVSLNTKQRMKKTGKRE